MSSIRVTFVAIIIAVFHGPRVEGSGLVEMISDYAKVVRNTERPTTTNGTDNKSISKAPPLDPTTEPSIEYQDFDDLQEEDRSLKQPSATETMMKYVNGLVSLLALMYKFNGSYGGSKPTRLRVKNQNEPRKKSVEEENLLQDTGKHFQEAQDRFEFPQKKFKYYENKMKDNMIDQQYQPVENYPPYNPYKATSAETYNQDDKKTSYDADLTQFDGSKNSINGYSTDVEVHQSYSYEIPYENPKPMNTPNYDLTNDGGSWGNGDNHPVYHPWMSKTPTKPANNENSYQPHKDEKPTHSEPWKSQPADPNLKDTEGRHPWHDKPIDFHTIATYHHDPPPKDDHFEYHEVEHPVDEDRVSKKPYSYYYLGRKLWYIPLLFSVYFIVYIGALVLKSIARHKIQFPEKLWDVHDEFTHGKHRRHRKIDDVTENYENAVEKMNNKFM